MSRALITGGAGFIGAHLAERLVREGLEVDLVDDFSRAVHDAELASLESSAKVRVLQRDLRLPGALDDLDDPYRYVVHLAAIVGVGRVVRQPSAVLGDSVTMLRNVVAAAARQPTPPRLVFLSTSEVYAGTLASFTLRFPTPESTPLTITELAQPRTAYMLSKIYGEAMCHYAGVPFTILRPHNVYGPRMGLSHVIPELLQRAHAAVSGGRLEVASVDHRRTFCHIDDAVEMIWRAASSPSCTGETLNIGVSEPEVSIGELAALIGTTVGKRVEIVALPPTPGSPPRRCPDMTRTRALTGYDPQVGLASGIRDTYDWYRTQVFDAAIR
ncbi:MAG: NAD(P)-dependent oxidoreductase [Actinomycetota bacterium]|nr:NAD(P)-dependent oxidoreductase [Actinomycetota bacterium]